MARSLRGKKVLKAREGMTRLIMPYSFQKLLWHLEGLPSLLFLFPIYSLEIGL